MRVLLAGRMAKTVGAVTAAGALHGALGTPWGAIALAAAAGVAALTAADVDNRADARSVVDILGAVAVYSAVRDACRKARAGEPAEAPTPSGGPPATRRTAAVTKAQAAGLVKHPRWRPRSRRPRCPVQTGARTQRRRSSPRAQAVPAWSPR
jgi:hypothetical protein